MRTPGFSQGRKENRRGIRYWARDFLTMTPKLAAYFRPDFHPDNADTSSMLEQWRDRLFGDQGYLSSHVTKTLYPKVQPQVNRQVAVS
jgi:hypothetical protein